jgi:nucleoside-diphosphate kinase
MIEDTLVLIKPDAFQRGLSGEIISRLERTGFTLKEMKLTKPSKELIEKHYPEDEEWLKSIGNKTIKTYEKYDLNIVDDIGTYDPLEVGKKIRKWLIQYVTSGPVIAMVVSGNHAVEMVRKLVGNTAPIFAELGTIRGDYSIDSPDLADREKRSIHNLVHASGNIKEAKKEIALWFN